MEILKFCPLCGHDKFDLIIEAHDYLVSGDKFSVVKCKNCGFLFTNPRPADDVLGEFYKSDDYISHTDSKQGPMERIYHLVREFMLKRKFSFISSQLQNTGRPAKLLDFGCGTGEFLNYTRNNGFDTVGIEPNDNARERAILKGLTVLPGINSEYFRNNSGFDVVSLWHVLEHLPNPVKVINDLGSLLAENGLIVVAVPEYRSYDALFYKNTWAAWDVPRHLNHFDESTLLRLFVNHGFNYIKKHPLIFDSFYVSLLSEKVKKAGMFGYVRAFMVGFISNFLAFFGVHPYSSQVYFFRRK